MTSSNALDSHIIYLHKKRKRKNKEEEPRIYFEQSKPEGWKTNKSQCDKTTCTNAQIVSYTCNELRCHTSENKKNMRNLCFSSGIEKEKKKQMKQFIQRGKKIRSKI